MPYRMKIDDPAKTAQYLYTRIQQTKQDRAEDMMTLSKLRGRVDGQVPERPPLFKGASNFSPPIATTFVLLFIARAAKALLFTDPTDFLIPNNAHGQKLRDKIVPYLRKRFKEGKWMQMARQWIHQCAVDGQAVMWEHWDSRPEPRMEILEVVDPAIGGTPTDEEQGLVLRKFIEQNYEWTVELISVTGDWEADVNCSKGPTLRQGTVKLVDKVGNTATMEWDFDEYKEGIKLELMDPERVGWDPHTKDPETEGMIWRQFSMSWGRLKRLEEEGKIVLPDRAGASEKLAKIAAGSEKGKEQAASIVGPAFTEGAGPETVRTDSSPGGLEAALQEEREQAQGVIELYASTLTDQLDIIEVIIPWEYRGTADKADCIFWLLLRTNSLISAEPLYRRYRHGMRPLSILWYSRFENRAHGRGIPWFLEPIEDEIYVFHNLTSDTAVWAMSAFGFFKPTAANNYTVALEVQPWTFFPLADPTNDVKIQTINPNFQIGLQFTMFLMQLARDLIGISEQTMGRPPKRARGVYDTLALMQEGNIRFEYIITQWGETFSRALTLWWKMEQQFAPWSETVQVPGVNGEYRFERAPARKDISKAEFSVEFNVNPNLANSAIMRQALQFVLATVSNPLLLQLGITDIGGWYNALEDLYKLLGVPCPQRYINRPPQALAKRQTPDEEWEAFLEDESITTHPTDDDQAHLQDHVGRIASADDEKLYGAQKITRWIAHIKAHEQQLMGKAMAQAQAAMQQQGGKVQNQGIVPPPSGSAEKTASTQAQPGQSSSAAGGANPATEPVSSLAPEQVTTATTAQEEL